MTSTPSSTRRNRLAAAVVATVLVLGSVGLAGCGGGPSEAARPDRDTIPTTIPSTSEAAPIEGASGDAAAIAFMREEEKLARDVYTVLGAEWGLPTFSNIATSEQQHMDAVATLLQRAGIDDPAAGAAPGEFRDPDLQVLYDRLVTRGLSSMEEALRVGVLIEETDIADLAARASDDITVQAVWDRLTTGSENHLRAFTAALARRAA